MALSRTFGAGFFPSAKVADGKKSERNSAAANAARELSVNGERGHVPEENPLCSRHAFFLAQTVTVPRLRQKFHHLGLFSETMSNPSRTSL
jgi:hypothetical protein